MRDRSMPVAEDRRIDPRYPIRVPVEYQHPTVVGRGTTWDVSLSGVRIQEASFLIRVGAALTLRFAFFPEASEVWFSANVVRHTENGFAVRFEDLDVEQAAILRQILRGTVD